MVFPEKMRVIDAYFLCFLGLSLFVPACSRTAGEQPPVIRYAKDRCAECGMIINEELFASALVGTNGEVAKFDDIGCMIRFRDRLSTVNVRRAWVHDYESGAWIEAQAAHFVHAQELVSPMGYSLAAFSEVSSAEQWAQKWKGEVIDLDRYQMQLKPTKEG